jgi:hypothetical protein
MLFKLPAPPSVSGLVVTARGIAVGSMGVVLFVELLGAMGALELMTLAGNTSHRNNQNQQGEKFHRAIA